MSSTAPPPNSDVIRAFDILRGGRPAEALPLFETLLNQFPDDPATWDGLATAFRAVGRLPESINTYLQAIQRFPNNAGLHNNLGLAYRALGEERPALKSLQAAAMCEPGWHQPLANLATLFRDMGDLGRADKCLQRALAIAPNDAELHNNLGGLRERQGDVPAALACYRMSLSLNPANAAKIHSNLLYILHFDESSTVHSLVAEHADFQHRYADPLLPEIKRTTPAPKGGRRLKIGYVSPDLRYHPVGRFMLPILRHHDKQNFEVYCYATLPRPGDEVTAELQSYTEHWKDVTTLSDADLADVIRADGIDVLVDLTMHMSWNRALLFARKPAPVQMCYLAYASTTGLSSIDYRIVDPHFDLYDSEEEYTERTLKLPTTYWCYEPRGEAPVSPLPALSRGYVTFGNLNNANKLSASAMRTFCDILKQLPNSRLLLHAGDGAPRQRIVTLATENGIDPNRIDFMGFAPLSEYFATYTRIDVALDPFPYAGGTTTCDALYMGVPVLTLAGQTPVGRGGVSINRNLNLPDWIAATPQDYVAKATAFAKDPQSLSTLRQSLRSRMQSSPLMNPTQFVQDLESLYARAAR